MTVRDKDGKITSCIFAKTGDAINEVLLKAAGEGIFGIDLQGITQFANPAAAEITGWTVEELIGQASHPLLHHTKIDGSTYHSSECPVHATFKNGDSHHVDDEVFWRKDGSSFCVEYTSTPIYDDGDLAGAVVMFKDISERRQAEDKLHKSEERFRRLFDNSSDALFLVEPTKDGRIIDCNQKACELLGYTYDELLTMQLSDVHPHEMPKFLEFAKSVQSVGHGQTDELTCQTNIGEKIPAEISASFFVGDAGIPLMLASVRNIKERKQAQVTLKRVMRHNELILSAAGEGVYGLDCEGKTTFVNPAAARMLGWDANELIGQPMHPIIHHTHPDGTPFPKEQCPIYAAFKDGAVHNVDDEIFWRKDKTSFPVEYTSTPIIDNGVLTGAVVIFKDVTERKQKEQELRRLYAEVAQMKERLEAENLYLQEEISNEHDFKYIIGQSSAVQRLMQQVELVAPTAASVLITGESGTGKELVARAIHEGSDRSERPLIRVNCAAIPAELFESEFFGHVKGSFTGAVKDRAGRFELADGGTIFLDEVGEIPLALQSKLLRVLQEGQYERVGDERTKKVDVRLIAATNKNLQEEVEAGNFREDLYFRLNVFPVNVIPLRERLDDIPLLAQHFLSVLSSKLKLPEPAMTNAMVKQLQGYSWKGNIRELQNIIERAIILSQGGSLQFDLPGSDIVPVAINYTALVSSSSDETQLSPYTESERIARDKDNIMQALKLCDNKISGVGGAAELLGIKPTTLASRLKNMDIRI